MQNMRNSKNQTVYHDESSFKFWKNPRYFAFEREVACGDPIRGIKPQNFPWNLQEESVQDTKNDIWSFSCHCIGAEPNVYNKKWRITLKLTAKLFLNTQHLAEWNYNPERIAFLGLLEDGIVIYEQEITIKDIALENLQQVAKSILKKFKEQCLKQTKEETKKNKLAQALHRTSISKFCHKGEEYEYK